MLNVFASASEAAEVRTTEHGQRRADLSDAAIGRQQTLAYSNPNVNWQYGPACYNGGITHDRTRDASRQDSLAKQYLKRNRNAWVQYSNMQSTLLFMQWHQEVVRFTLDVKPCF